MEKKYKTAKKRYKYSKNIKNKYKKRRTKKNIRKIKKTKKYGGCVRGERCTTLYSKSIGINNPYEQITLNDDISNNGLTYLMYINSENVNNLKNVDELFYLLKQYSKNKTIDEKNTESYEVTLQGITKKNENKNTEDLPQPKQPADQQSNQPTKTNTENIDLDTTIDTKVKNKPTFESKSNPAMQNNRVVPHNTNNTDNNTKSL